MARDRLAALRAQQGNAGGYGGIAGDQNQYSGIAGGQNQYGGYGGGQNQYGGYGGGQNQYGGYGGGQNQYGGYGDEQNQYGGYGGDGGGYGGAPAGGPTHGYEMTPVGGNGAAAPNDMTAFFGEISDLQDAVRSIDDNVNRISDLHSRTLNNMDEAQSQQAHAQLNSVITETSRLTNTVKSKIKTLEQQNSKMPPGGDVNVRRTQVGAVKNRFMETIQRYQQVEQQYRQKYRQRMERQYRIVKPDATQQEIKAALDDDQGGQIFSQALLNSNRQGDARAAYREVQERHEDIRKIEQTITELAQLFNEMAMLVERDDEALQDIETHAAQVNTDMEEGYKHTEKAKESARKARKKRWICFFIILIILIIVGVVVGVVVSNQVRNNQNNKVGK